MVVPHALGVGGRLALCLDLNGDESVAAAAAAAGGLIALGRRRPRRPVLPVPPGLLDDQLKLPLDVDGAFGRDLKACGGGDGGGEGGGGGCAVGGGGEAGGHVGRVATGDNIHLVFCREEEEYFG